MDYFPALIYSNPEKYVACTCEYYFSIDTGPLNVHVSMVFLFFSYWPTTDVALKSAMYNRGIKVRVMGSIWEYTESDMLKFLKSLQEANATGQQNGTLEVVSGLVKLYSNG